MTRTLAQLARFTFFLFIVLASSTHALTAHALTLEDVEFKPIKAKALNDRPAALTSKFTHKRLSRSHTALIAEKYDQAIEMLKKLEAQTKSRPFELAQVYQTLGFAYANKDDLKNAVVYFKKSIDLKSLPTSPTLSSLYTLAQLQIGQEMYQSGLTTLLEWFHHVKKPRAQAYVLLATALFELKKKGPALVFINKALELSQVPAENWLQFAVALNYENKKYKEAASALRLLVERYPQKKKYWKQLVGVYLNLDDISSALATIQMAYKIKHMTEDKELLNMISLQLTEEIPYKAAKALESFMNNEQVPKNKKHFEILAQAWIQSEELERAIDPLQKAAELSKDGKVAAKQGHLLLELGRFSHAVKAYSMSLKKGGLKSPGRIYLARGIAQLNLKKYEEAIANFEKAQGIEKTSQAAEQWLQHVHLEKRYTSSYAPQ